MGHIESALKVQRGEESSHSSLKKKKKKRDKKASLKKYGLDRCCPSFLWVAIRVEGISRQNHTTQTLIE